MTLRKLTYIIVILFLMTGGGSVRAGLCAGTVTAMPDSVWEIPNPYADIKPVYVMESHDDSTFIQLRWQREMEEEELAEMWQLRENYAYISFTSKELHYKHPEEILHGDDTILIQLVDSACVYVHPFKGRVTSRFGPRWGRMHYGTDIGLATGDTIVAAFDGVVRVAQRNYSYGNIAIIFHKNGLETYYAHMSKLLVEPNQVVKAGQPIGLGGNTGRSRGSHLHLEIRYLGVPIDAQFIIDFQNFALLSETFPLCKNTVYGISSSGIRYHKIKQGETLSSLARKYHTSVSRIKALNNIKGNTIRAGAVIRVR